MFADTNVILEAFRTGCWTAIASRFAIETAEKCVEEALTGNPGDRRHVNVPPAELSNNLLPSQVIAATTADKAALVASHGLGWLDCMTSLKDLARKPGIDRGNLDLLALQYREDWLSNID